MTRFSSSTLRDSHGPAGLADNLAAEARDLISRTSGPVSVYVSLAHKNMRGKTPAPDIRPDGTADLPLCSFGPGGGYVVDWQVRRPDLADPRRAFPPRTVGSILRRVTGWMLWDLKGWLIATHPSRTYRADSHPAALDPCGACGHSDSWPEWFVATNVRFDFRSHGYGDSNAGFDTDHWAIIAVIDRSELFTRRSNSWPGSKLQRSTAPSSTTSHQLCCDGGSSEYRNCIVQRRSGKSLTTTWRRISHIKREGSRFFSDSRDSIHRCAQLPSSMINGRSSSPASERR